ncbi:MAG: antibiotic biosynthesis monooxygenase [Anaerolineae bacterium]|nr:antibiotic biosynthesis monooxygenase [Anaerolineae bacterium]
MFTWYVDLHVRPERIAEFRQAIVEHATHTLTEPGAVRFDVFQQHDQPSHFILIEVYHSEDDLKRHMETDYFHQWRTRTAGMFEPATATRFESIHLTGQKVPGSSA